MKFELVVRWKSKCFLLCAMFLQIAFNVVVLIDIPIARQVVGFLCLTSFLGIAFVNLLGINELDGVETVVLSSGFSIAFVMLAGLFVNELGPLFNVPQPLSLVPLMTVLNVLLSISWILVYFKGGCLEIYGCQSTKEWLATMLFLCLPILSIIGAMYSNVHGSNLFLLFAILLIPLVFVFSVLHTKMPSWSYSLLVFTIAIALLYHSSFISRYIIPFGSDAPGEYFVSRTVEGYAHWDSTLPSLSGLWFARIGTMASVTILPMLYTSILNISLTPVFKLLYPLVFSLVPLGLYQVWQIYIGKKYAFASAFLFMSFETFYTEMLGLNRQMIAELFFVLLLLTMMSSKMKPASRNVCFIVFSFGLITSHYSLAVLFLFFISFVLVLSTLLKRPARNITSPMLVFSLH